MMLILNCFAFNHKISVPKNYLFFTIYKIIQNRFKRCHSKTSIASICYKNFAQKSECHDHYSSLTETKNESIGHGCPR